VYNFEPVADVVHLVSGCGSLEEFAAAFRRLTERQGLFIPTATPLPLGKRTRIELTLRDGAVVIARRDRGGVVEPHGPPGLHGRPGMGLRLLELDPPSREIIEYLVSSKLAPKPLPPQLTARPQALPPGLAAVGRTVDGGRHRPGLAARRVCRERRSRGAVVGGQAGATVARPGPVAVVVGRRGRRFRCRRPRRSCDLRPRRSCHRARPPPAAPAGVDSRRTMMGFPAPNLPGIPRALTPPPVAAAPVVPRTITPIGAPAIPRSLTPAARAPRRRRSPCGRRRRRRSSSHPATPPGGPESRRRPDRHGRRADQRRRAE
jgi:hypothetical protein